MSLSELSESRRAYKRLSSSHTPLSVQKTQGGYEQRFPSLAELTCEGMWWAVRSLARRHAARRDEYDQFYHYKTAAGWAQHHGLPNLSSELKYYVSGRHDLCSANVTHADDLKLS
jgi:hypothetical protein